MKRRAVVTILAVSIFFAAYALANTPGQSTTGSSGQFTPPSASTVSAGGGNVTEINVSADVSTSKWQGYWGNVSGSLRLGDGSNVFFDWTGVEFIAVYASPNNNPNWDTVTPITTQGDKETKDGAFGFTSTDPDSITNTMTGSSCAAGTEIAGAAGVTPFDNVGNPGSWETCIADIDGAGVERAVFGTTIIPAGATAFNGLTVQFQLMVPAENGGTDYYFFLEI